MSWIDIFVLLMVMLGFGLGISNVHRALRLLRKSDGEDGRWLIGWGLFQIAFSSYLITLLSGLA